MFASFCILDTISVDSLRTGFLAVDIPAADDAIPKPSLIDFLELTFLILNVPLIVSYINLAYLAVSSLSKVSTTRSFCTSSN